MTVGWPLAEADPEAVPEAAPDEPAELGELASGDGEGAVLAEGVADPLADGVADVFGNSDVLAGVSLRNEVKIWLSSGWVHSTLAVSVGTTSDRG